MRPLFNKGDKSGGTQTVKMQVNHLKETDFYKHKGQKLEFINVRANTKSKRELWKKFVSELNSSNSSP